MPDDHAPSDATAPPRSPRLATLAALARHRRTLDYVWALLDQGAVSALNFLIVLAYGRLLGPAVFEQFVVAFTLLTFSMYFCLTYWVTPSLVLSHLHFASAGRSYFGQLRRLNAASALLLGVAIVLVTRPFIMPLPWLDLALAVAVAVAWSDYELKRKKLNARGKLPVLGAGGVAVVGAFLLGVGGFYLTGTLNLSTALLAIVLAYALGSVVVQLAAPPHAAGEPAPLGRLLGAHWRYARWPVLGLPGIWLVPQGVFLLAAHYLPAEEVGAARVSLNLIGLFTVVLVAFENYQTTRSSRLMAERGLEPMTDNLKRVGLGWAGFATPTILGITLVTLAVYPWLYGEQYGPATGAILAFGFYQWVLALSKPFVAGIRALEKTVYFMITHWTVAVIVLTLGSVLIIQFGTLGVALTLLGSGLIHALIFPLAFLWRRRVLLQGAGHG